MQFLPYCAIRLKWQAGWVLLYFMLCTVPLAGAGAPPAPVLILGDSISAAYGMSLEQGWVAQLQDTLQADYPGIVVVNASISGETTQGALRRLPRLLEEHQPALVVIELGGNDGLRGYPLPNLRQNLSDLVTLSRQAGAAVVLVPMEIPPNYGARYTAGFRESFTLTADNHEAILAPFILDGVATQPQLMQADGIHPTTEAQAILLANMLPSVRGALATQ